MMWAGAFLVAVLLFITLVLPEVAVMMFKAAVVFAGFAGLLFGLEMILG